MAQIDKNTVKATNQLGNRSYITFENESGKGIRVLFVGNSITRHSPKEEIGWFNDWGMAASSKENDYVHVVKSKILETNPDATFCICQAAAWESNYIVGDTKLEDYDIARDFDADIIIIRLIENCPHKEFQPDTFEEQYKKFVQYFNKSEKAATIVTTGFWKHPGDSVITKVANDMGIPCVYLGDLGEQSDMRADGLFEHGGVAAHPSDKGMGAIAEMIYEELAKILNK